MVRKPYIPTGRPRGRPRKERRIKKASINMRKEKIEIQRMIEGDENQNHIEIVRRRKCCVRVVRVLQTSLYWPVSPLHGPLCLHTALHGAGHGSEKGLHKVSV